MARDATASSGYSCFKLKITGDVDLDAARVRAVAAATNGKPLWLDANQAYRPSGFRRLLPLLADLPQLVCAEQPVPSADWAGLAAIRRWSTLPIAVDEGCFTATDLAKIAVREAADMVVRLDV